MSAFKMILSLTAALLFSLSSVQSFAQTGENSQLIYVCNQGEATVSIIDAKSLEITAKVDLKELGFSANAKPHHAIAEADGSHWYVTLIGENRVLKFNRDNELISEANLEVPGLLAMHPQGETLMVGRSMSAVNPPQSFGMLSKGDMNVTDEVGLFFNRPHALATGPDGKWTYVASLSSNQILARNMETGESALTNIPGDNHVFVNFAVSPDGNTLVATGQVSGQLLIFDLSDPARPELRKTLEVGAMPWHPVYSKDGRYVYFANKGMHTVTMVDMEQEEIEVVIEGEGLAQPHGAVLSDDDRYLFVTNNNRNGRWQPEGFTGGDDVPGTVTVINTETRQVEKIIEVGIYPTGIGTHAR